MFKAIAYNYQNKVVEFKDFELKDDCLAFLKTAPKQNNSICEWQLKEVYSIPKEQKKKVTIYLTGGLSSCPHPIEAYLLEYGKQDYAQYKQIPYIKYICKGKRTPQQHMKGYDPFILVVDGWNKSPCPEMLIKEEQGFATISTSKYTSFDNRYISDFNKWFNEQNLNIIVDYRFNKEVG